VPQLAQATDADASAAIDGIVQVVRSDASVAWSDHYGAPGSFEKAWGAAIGPVDEVVLVGTERPTQRDDLTPWVRRYDLTGALTWSHVPATTGVVFGAAIDTDGTIATAAIGDEQLQLCRWPPG
jgi:hypothetical protein